VWLSRWLNGNYTRRELEKKRDEYDSCISDALFKRGAKDRITICYEHHRNNLMKERCAKNVEEEIEGLLQHWQNLAEIHINRV